MYISKLSLVNYRNFSTTKLLFKKGVNTVIGENGSGKTNLFRAIRLLLDDNMIRSAYKLEEIDFHRGLKDWRGHWIIISVEFDEISPDEAIQALFLHGAAGLDNQIVNKATYNLIFRPKKEIRIELNELLPGDHEGLTEIRSKISTEDYETLFTGKSNTDFCDPKIYNDLVGDFENCEFETELDDPRIGAKVPTILSVAREVSFTFIQALRDVVSEFHNNRTNPLLNLLKFKSGEMDEVVMEPIVRKVLDLNTSIEDLEDVQIVRSDIRETIKDAAGETYAPRSLSIKSDLPDEANKLFQSLRLFVGESDDDYEGVIHELSLGGANLIYLTLKLLEFKYQHAHQSIANFLVIEEPEAHIHTHIQKTLFDRIKFSNTQIIHSTHSTHLSEASNVERVNILGRNNSACEAYQPTQGLTLEEVGNIQRYLDAVRSNLLFAKSVLLVEGDSEEILIPILFKKVLGLSLDELGISLINIRSTGFKNIAVLFHKERIRKHCSIITDLDSAFIDTTLLPGDTPSELAFKKKCQASQESGALRKVDLDTLIFGNPYLSAHYAENTFEVDLVSAGNSSLVTATLSDVYTQESTISKARAELAFGNKEAYGRRVLTMASNQGKGWFAILLGKYVDHNTVIPEYILDAIVSARKGLTKELIFNICIYRIDCALSDEKILRKTARKNRVSLKKFRRGEVDLDQIKTLIADTLPNDQIHSILNRIS